MYQYQPGNRVRVRSDLFTEIKYYMADHIHRDVVTPSMLKWRGSVVTISEITSYGKYHIEEDCLNWTDEMFDGLAEPPVEIDDLV